MSWAGDPEVDVERGASTDLERTQVCSAPFDTVRYVLAFAPDAFDEYGADARLFSLGPPTGTQYMAPLPSSRRYYSPQASILSRPYLPFSYPPNLDQSTRSDFVSDYMFAFACLRVPNGLSQVVHITRCQGLRVVLGRLLLHAGWPRL